MAPPGLLYLAQLVAILEGACFLILGLVVLLLEAILVMSGGAASAVMAVVGAGIAAAAIALILAAFQLVKPSQTARWLVLSAQAVLAAHALFWVSTSTVVSGAPIVVCETVASVIGLYVLLADRPTRLFLSQRHRARGLPHVLRQAMPVGADEPAWLRASWLIIDVQALVAIAAGWLTAVLMYVIQLSTTRDGPLLQFAGACGAAAAIAGWLLLLARAVRSTSARRNLGTVTWMAVVVIEAAFAAAAIDVILAAIGNPGSAWLDVGLGAASITLASAAAVLVGIGIEPASRHAWLAPDGAEQMRLPRDGWLMVARRIVIVESASCLVLGITLVAFSVVVAAGNGERAGIGIGVELLNGTAFFGIAGLVLGALWLVAGLLLGRANDAARWAVIVVSALIVLANAAAVIVVPPATSLTTATVSPPGSVDTVALAGIVAGVATIYALLHPATNTIFAKARSVSR